MVFHVNGTPVGFEAIFLAVLASMGGFIFGYDTGQISDILLMKDFLIRFAQNSPSAATGHAFTNVREGLVVALLSIGTLIGALCGAYIADSMGRRRAITVECGVFVIGVIIQLTSFHAWYQIAIGRLISGLGVGALSAAVPTYQAETAPKQIRGTLIGTYQLFITFGILVAYCISIATRSIDGSGSWRTVVGIGIIWAVILGVGILFMPESPRWLARRDRLDEARLSLARIRGLAHSPHEPIVNEDYDEIINRVQEERSAGAGDSTWADCFRSSVGGTNKIRYRTLLLMSLQALQQLTGANYFFYYGATIFTSVGISDSYVTQIILGAVNFACTFLGLYVMEHFGRRKPLIIGGLWQSMWLFIFAAVGTAKDPTQKEIGKVMIVSACLFILGYASTWAPGIWILTGETFPLRTRAKQAALATASNWLWNFLLAFFTPFIVGDIQYRYGFIFASCNLLGAVVVYFFLYESSGLSLEAVDAMYSDRGVKAWQSSSSIPPVGYHSRGEDVATTKTKGEVGHQEFVGGEKRDMHGGDGSRAPTAIGDDGRESPTDTASRTAASEIV
ncbi:general substrate transporter [Clavulina sp. PMI_390]|nr:general substrate transporter [Clavulina sp. PMI_390]